MSTEIDELYHKVVAEGTKLYNSKYTYLRIAIFDLSSRRLMIEYTCPDCNTKSVQTISSHLAGRGCDKCNHKNAIGCNTVNEINIFVKASGIHNNKYKYVRLTEATGISLAKRIVYECPECNTTRSQLLDIHLRGGGCQKCANIIRGKRSGDKRKLTFDKAVAKGIETHGDLYEYVELIPSHNEDGKFVEARIVYNCKACGLTVTQRVSNHLHGSGCQCKRYAKSKH